MKFGFPVKFLFGNYKAPGSGGDEEEGMGKVWCFKWWMVEWGVSSREGCSPDHAELLASWEEAVTVKPPMAPGLLSTEGDPGQVVFPFTEVPYSTLTIKD